MDTVVLSGKKDLDIYFNPQRQNLLRCMRIAGVPMTPKQIADRLGISPSSVQYHIGKLMSLGVVALSHTERIHGITARYYRAAPKVIQIGLATNPKNREERLLLMQYTLSAIFSGFSEYCQKDLPDAREGEPHGDMLSGVVRLTREEAAELSGVIRCFLEKHEQDKTSGAPWEYALIAYPAGEIRNA